MVRVFNFNEVYLNKDVVNSKTLAKIKSVNSSSIVNINSKLLSDVALLKLEVSVKSLNIIQWENAVKNVTRKSMKSMIFKGRTRS